MNDMVFIKKCTKLHKAFKDLYSDFPLGFVGLSDEAVQLTAKRFFELFADISKINVTVSKDETLKHKYFFSTFFGGTSFQCCDTTDHGINSEVDK